ncbi:MAG: hypothetical protein U0324_31095 [Polyangiales bacterium]
MTSPLPNVPSPQQLRAWLAKHGWRAAPEYSDDGADAFEGDQRDDDGEALRVFVPTAVLHPDYLAQVRLLLLGLATLTHTSEEALLAEIVADRPPRYPGIDEYRSRMRATGMVAPRPAGKKAA